MDESFWTAVRDLLRIMRDFLTTRVHDRRWLCWRADWTWMSLYFFIGGLCSIWLFDAAPGAMDEREVGERVRLMATVVAICSAGYFITFSITNSIKDPYSAHAQVEEKSRGAEHSGQHVGGNSRARKGNEGPVTAPGTGSGTVRKRGNPIASATDSSTDDNFNNSNRGHGHARSHHADASSGTDSPTKGSDSGRSNYSVFLAKDPMFYRGLSEAALQQHLDVELDKLLTQRIWKYMFYPLPEHDADVKVTNEID